jgi:preprotein translocase subunit YajC
VKSVGDDTFAVSTQGGTTVTVDVSASTAYMEKGVTSPTFADIKVGTQVAVFGTETSGTITATSVGIGAPPAPPAGGGSGGPGGSGGSGAAPAAVGTVKSVGDDTLAVSTQGGTTVTVDVSASTTYMESGVTSPSFTDVKVGTQVAVFGTESSGTVTATSVCIGTPPAPPAPGGSAGPGGPGGPGAPSGSSAKGGGSIGSAG